MSHSLESTPTTSTSSTFQFTLVKDDFSEEYEQRNRIERTFPEFLLFDCKVNYIRGRTESHDKTLLRLTQTIAQEHGVKFVQYSLELNEWLLADENEETGYKVVKTLGE